MSANPYRGEASLKVAGEAIVIRPSFAALVAAEGELGPLFALVERAAEGRLGIGEMATLFDHLSAATRPAAIDRARIGEAIVEQGLAGISPMLKLVLGQILQGR
ncbi:MAG: gene transfer agent family protein [Sphingomonas sp.]|uniref:GTA-gp10 family protein n=1 Tax=Sphingomonas sp. TaxID=28214 RepID=UPI0017BCA641|nr:GTA-gp10 family protein [Sphingomonas sp.]MBA3667757.1 gene transfer agent family protein [Sphingomonas sp.]